MLIEVMLEVVSMNAISMRSMPAPQRYLMWLDQPTEVPKNGIVD